MPDAGPPQLATYGFLDLCVRRRIFAAVVRSGPMQAEGLRKAACKPSQRPRSLGLHVIEKDEARQQKGLDRVE